MGFYFISSGNGGLLILTDWDRLMEYIHDYFPEPKYKSQDIRKWAMDNVPAWKYMSSGLKDDIITDWENFIVTQLEDIIEDASPTFWGRISGRVKGFLGRLWGRE